jgi:hypothetical protein
MAEDTNIRSGRLTGRRRCNLEIERFLSVMSAPGEKFHGLAKNFFAPPMASKSVFPPPIRLRIETGVL